MLLLVICMAGLAMHVLKFKGGEQIDLKMAASHTPPACMHGAMVPASHPPPACNHTSNRRRQKKVIMKIMMRS